MKGRALGFPQRRCKGNNKLKLNEIGCEGVDCIHLAQNRPPWQAVGKKTGAT